GLFGSGAYMTSEIWTWSTRWIDVSIAGLVLIALQGPLVGDRTAHKLKHALMENGPGPLGAHARRMTRHPGLWVVEFTNLGLVLPVVDVLEPRDQPDAAKRDLVRARVVADVVRLARAVDEVGDPLGAGDDRVRDARAARPADDVSGPQLVRLQRRAARGHAR